MALNPGCACQQATWDGEPKLRAPPRRWSALPGRCGGVWEQSWQGGRRLGVGRVWEGVLGGQGRACREAPWERRGQSRERREACASIARETPKAPLGWLLRCGGRSGPQASPGTGAPCHPHPAGAALSSALRPCASSFSGADPVLGAGGGQGPSRSSGGLETGPWRPPPTSDPNAAAENQRGRGAFSEKADASKAGRKQVHSERPSFPGRGKLLFQRCSASDRHQGASASTCPCSMGAAPVW